MKKKLRVILPFILLLPLNALADSELLILQGSPKIRTLVSEDVNERMTLESYETYKHECLISKVNNRYFWTSKDDKELIKSESGIFDTFYAVDGSGYVRRIRPSEEGAINMLLGVNKDDAKAQYKYDYIEHFIVGLRSTTYQGVLDLNQ